MDKHSAEYGFNFDIGFNFDNSYARLPKEFFARVNPTPVRSPKMALLNHELAEALGLNAETLATDKGVSFLSGNAVLPGGESIAQAYAGHQFGHFTMLGDGRAHLLGEHVTPKGDRFDIQLKGSGPTPFSRRGDGRAALGPMLREYLISEAMHALGIPSTRSLAVVMTGEPVLRESLLPGAILTRVASSHIRVGTFEYAAAIHQRENQSEHLQILADYTLRRHYPELVSNPEPYLSLLNAVIERQASLVAKWVLVGFIHGVMNTDNVALAGETIDYGPCAFMDRYSPSTVFSSIDRQGRYAYGNQPLMAEWNLARFAETLVPLLDPDQNKAIAKAEKAIETFGVVFERHWLAGMRSKLGLVTEESDDASLITSLLNWMEKHEADYTNTFRALSSEPMPDQTLFQESEFSEWHKRWQSRKPSLSLMRSVNPAVIPRNHRLEEALTAAVSFSDFSVLERLLAVLKKPYEESTENQEYRNPPPSGGEEYRTFCGT